MPFRSETGYILHGQSETLSLTCLATCNVLHCRLYVPETCQDTRCTPKMFFVAAFTALDFNASDSRCRQQLVAQSGSEVTLTDREACPELPSPERIHFFCSTPVHIFSSLMFVLTFFLSTKYVIT